MLRIARKQQMLERISLFFFLDYGAQRFIPKQTEPIPRFFLRCEPEETGSTNETDGDTEKVSLEIVTKNLSSFLIA